MLKALEIGHINNTIAMTCIKMLEELFNALPPKITVELYSEILPKLSNYLVDDSEQSTQSNLYYH